MVRWYILVIFSTPQPLHPLPQHVCRRRPARMQSSLHVYIHIPGLNTGAWTILTTNWTNAFRYLHPTEQDQPHLRVWPDGPRSVAVEVPECRAARARRESFEVSRALPLDATPEEVFEGTTKGRSCRTTFFQFPCFFFPRKTGKEGKTGNISKLWKFNRGQNISHSNIW